MRDDETQETEAGKSLNKKLTCANGSNDSSPQHGELPLPEVFTSVGDADMQDSVKSLSEKLSAALLTISAKEDLVKQHAKVAEDAVAGWEHAEGEVSNLKRLLDASSLKNASLEDQVSHLDGALKECVRQLRQAREEHEEKIRDAVAKKSHELESEMSELQNNLADLQQQLEASDLREKLQVAEKECKDLKIELLTLSKELKMLALERDLSSQEAETASKQHLESVKKITRVEAECRRLRHVTRRTSLANDSSRPVPNNACMESLTDSQSDSGEHMLAIDSEVKNSDLWASALIAELDQFKNGNEGARDLVNNPVEIDLMDDFLEMEKLAALPEVDRTSSSFGTETDSDRAVTRDISRGETEALQHQVMDLQAKMQLNLANESKDAALGQAELLDGERKSLAFQLESKSAEVEKLQGVVTKLEESGNSKELELQLQLESTTAEVANLCKMVTSLEEKIDAEKTLLVQHKADSDMAKAAKDTLEAQLRSANTEIGQLRGIIKTLESEVQKGKVCHKELEAQIEAMKTESERTFSVESAKESLEAQLLVANSETAKLHVTVNALESDAAKEREYSSEVKIQLEAVEGIRKVLGSELESAHQETMKLQEKVLSLEVRLKEQSVLLVEFTAKAEDAMSARKAMGSQLEEANQELAKLTNKVSLLQGKIEQEKLLSEEYEAKCRRLEAQLSRDSREAKLWRLANTNGDLKFKQEEEVASAAGKLAECQRTIANLGLQLKSLTNLDSVMTEPGKLESKDTLLDFREDGTEPPADESYGLHLPVSNGGCASPVPRAQSPSSRRSVFSGYRRLVATGAEQGSEM
uniref:Filament-like plant protein n=1 Tax=Aegilops tauschii subsp. strangulata TaxID=200361 RepID=A0A453HLX5_AEGTS